MKNQEYMVRLPFEIDLEPHSQRDAALVAEMPSRFTSLFLQVEGDQANEVLVTHMIAARVNVIEAPVSAQFFTGELPSEQVEYSSVQISLKVPLVVAGQPMSLGLRNIGNKTLKIKGALIGLPLVDPTCT